MKALSGELDYRIRYDVEHDLFHAQNVFNDEYITPTFIEYVQKLEKENEQAKRLLMEWYDITDGETVTCLRGRTKDFIEIGVAK